MLAGNIFTWADFKHGLAKLEWRSRFSVVGAPIRFRRATEGYLFFVFTSFCVRLYFLIIATSDKQQFSIICTK
jgi:hypothetical protein